jgi:hypothetical protein
MSSKFETVSKAEYGLRWGISTRTIERLVLRGLPVIKLGHRLLRIETHAADRWMKRFGRRHQ